MFFENVESLAIVRDRRDKGINELLRSLLVVINRQIVWTLLHLFNLKKNNLGHSHLHVLNY